MKKILSKMMVLSERLSDRWWTMLAGISIMSAAPQRAGAQTVGGSLERFNEDIGTSIPSLIATGAYIIGVSLAIGGLLQIRKHVQQPQQVPLKEGGIALVIGVCIISITAIIQMIQGSFAMGLGGGLARPTL